MKIECAYSKCRKMFEPSVQHFLCCTGLCANRYNGELRRAETAARHTKNPPKPTKKKKVNRYIGHANGIDII